MAKVDIWMPIYIGDYLRDTEELSAVEHGVYLLLLMHYWLKNGEIGCDVDRLSRVARTDEKTARFILGYYFALIDGNYKNKRADLEMQNANNRRLAASVNGKKGGRPPINNPQKTGGLSGGLSVGIPDDNRRGNPRKSSSSSSSPSKKDKQEEIQENMRFAKPTLEDVRTYCIERKNNVNPERWMNHYESKGWKIGKAPMKDWKAAVRTWEGNDFPPRALKVNQRSSFLEMEE